MSTIWYDAICMNQSITQRRAYVNLRLDTDSLRAEQLIRWLLRA